ncbi:MAG: hypothetical protein AB7D24_03030 [Sphaerochaeta sp.]|jgi:hypothetical protein|uniref:hypothetical protein n=1 Tax=Sphaerochaeta sp. TaxID=1972642 RepID=UPI003D13A197
MKRFLAVPLILIAFSASLAANTTIAGISGYIVIPSAEVTPSTIASAVTTSYSATLGSNGAVHIPALQLAFKDTFETSLAVDIADNTDILLNAKWLFSKKGTTSFAAGLLGQWSSVSKDDEVAAQIYFASTFDSSIMDYPSKTTLLVGYSLMKGMNSDINFALAFQTPLLAKTFKNKVDFLLDFGNVSYSATPSAGNAENRGLVNVGIRLLPIEFLKSIFIAVDIRALDLFDHEGRALSLGASISFRP